MEILRCLQLPIQEKTLMVPYAAVAEIVVFENPKAFAETKNWSLGPFQWRGLEIPLICLEMQGGASSFSAKKNFENLHVAVFNRMSELNAPDFMGIVLQGLPVMTRYKRADLEYVGPGDKPYLAMEIKVRGKSAFIPNISSIEETVAKLQGSSARRAS